ncbi:NADH-ubiquinone oxidoreductase-F iron-sulfur binding region domain-containing protein [Rhodoferax sp. UBA5149]|uniref:NADH-ubiquinone oxidoreductase-F iron-sulfur binding region domain-containing protein n=1 Tax=Rhodoferax sp. UBA5149 TaxID=1947379 RepID=UPI0025F2262C|nr:NADH-ubiquinone oxidoreductase-F iron-sulfur binding region domain-containing protein [Rhodoferax sp. UBA5149]
MNLSGKSSDVIAMVTVDEMRERIRCKSKLKGRQVDDASLQEVRALVGAVPHRRDLLIEHLHQLNDAYCGLHERHLVALAKEMKLPMAEVYEVATFYHHFEVLRGDEQAPGLTVRVCDGLSCELAGAQDLLARLPGLLGISDVRVIPTPCVGRCEQAPVAVVHQRPVPLATTETIVSLVNSAVTLHPSGKVAASFVASEYAEQSISPLPQATMVSPDYAGYAAYRAHGGYALAAVLVNGEADAERVIKTMEDSGLRGLGGAGFPAGRKWRIVREQAAPRLMAVNIDEGEPGTFKDRTYLERDPHRFLEGLLIAAQVVGINACYIYLPGGASGGILPARLNNIPLDFDTLQPYGCFIGSAAVIVLSQHDSARNAALNMMQFFAHESCGQCTPCRVGTAKAVKLMEAPVWDNTTLEDLNIVMTDASICGLGQAAPNPVRSIQRYFSQEIV